jgi:phosphatidylglycerol:prolipoprotein diacylglycerol transferase
MSFHWYGFIIGVAAVVGIWLSELRLRKYHIDEKKFEQTLWLAVVAGFIAARAWHVVTDFHLYHDNLWAILYVWQGGLSIIGALLGAVSVVSIAAYVSKDKQFLLQFLDIAVFGLPVAQAIGRVGNYSNQELYGLPTQLPWAIYIPLEKRPLNFLEVGYFHPLFAYEMVATALFAGIVWLLEKKKYNLQIGSGRLALTYVLYYSVIRFLLDFLRIDSAVVYATLGINQLVLLFTITLVSILLVLRYKNAYAQ